MVSFGFYNVSTVCLLYSFHGKCCKDICSPVWQSTSCCPKLVVHARASLGQEMQPLDLVAVAVLAAKAPGPWLAYSLCSGVLSSCVLLGEGALALLEAQTLVIEKLKALKQKSLVV